MAYPLWSYQVAIDLDHFSAGVDHVQHQSAAAVAPLTDRPPLRPHFQSRGTPATANDIIHRATDLQRPCCHQLRIRRLGSNPSDRATFLQVSVYSHSATVLPMLPSDWALAGSAVSAAEADDSFADSL